MRLAVADQSLRDRIQDATFLIWNEGLTRQAFGRWNEGQMQTAWGREHLHRLALLDDDGRVVASMKRFRFKARYDGEIVPLLGIGAVFTMPEHRRRGFGEAMVERVLAEEVARGTAVAALFSEIGAEYYRRFGFEPVPLDEVRLAVTLKGGAPAVLVRSGTDADLPALAAMHESRAAAARFSMLRPAELVQFAIAKRRLFAGLSRTGARQTEFFVAEEGLMPVAYVVLSIDEWGWFLEEGGDRDPCAARFGAMLQVLLARDPSRPPAAIRAWWPKAFPIPPQVTIEHREPARDLFMVRPLREGLRPLAPDDVFYWHSDNF